MSLNSSLDTMRQLFARQFEAEGDGIVYRKAMKGAPVRVSAEEQDQFIAAYNRDIRIGYWGFIAAMIAVMALVIGLSMPGDGDADFPVIPLIAGLALIFVVFMGSTTWAYYEPARALAQRRPVGEARTREEMRRRQLENLTYGQVAGFAGAGIIVLVQIEFGQPLWSGTNLLWLGAFIVMETVIAWAAWRKWRFERQKNADFGDRPRWE